MGQAQFRATRQPRVSRGRSPVLVCLSAVRRAAMKPRVINRGLHLPGASRTSAQQPKKKEALHFRTPASERFLRGAPLLALVRVAGALGFVRGKSPISCGKTLSRRSAGMSEPLLTRWQSRQ